MGLALLAMGGAALTAGRATAAGLEVGGKVPDVALTGTDGKTHRLTEEVGKRWLVLAWLPKAFTPG